MMNNNNIIDIDTSNDDKSLDSNLSNNNTSNDNKTKQLIQSSPDSWYLGDLYSNIDSNGVKRIYPLITSQKIFLILHDPSSCLLARIVNTIMLITIVISCANFIFSTSTLFQYQPKTCSNPVCNNSDLCLGYMVCRPVVVDWMNIVDFICIIIFTIDFGLRVLTVGSVPARLSGLVPDDLDDLLVELHEFNSDSDIVEYSKKVIDDHNSKLAATERHNNLAISQSLESRDEITHLFANAEHLLVNSVHKTYKTTRKSYKAISNLGKNKPKSTINRLPSSLVGSDISRHNSDIYNDDNYQTISSETVDEKDNIPYHNEFNSHFDGIARPVDSFRLEINDNEHAINLKEHTNNDSNLNDDILLNNMISYEKSNLPINRSNKKKRKFRIKHLLKYIRRYTAELFNVVVPNKDNTSDTDIDYRWNVKVLLYSITIFSIIDLATIIPFYVSYITSSGAKTSFLRVLRLVRVVKVFNFSKLFRNGIYALFETIQRSLQPLLLVSFFIFLGIVFFGSLIFFFESGTYKVTNEYPKGAYFIEGNLGGDVVSLFRSIPVCLYWAVVTSTTTGYGDIYPLTIGGKIVAVLTMYFGVVLVALPITVIGNNFNRVYNSLIGEDTEDVIYKAIVDLCEIIDNEVNVMKSSNFTRNSHTEVMNKVMLIVSTLDDNQRERLIDKLQVQIKEDVEIEEFNKSMCQSGSDTDNDDPLNNLVKELIPLMKSLESKKES
mmetsp:Transcript_25126/g.22845  ORF Transcript_25126/g.22845 Transcript_25126/m.22845 type:complete len:720 (-) Transcript_25126:493-2652(-)